MARTNSRNAKLHCTKCERDLSPDDFYRDKSQKSRGGRAVWCKSCERNYNRAYRQGLTNAKVERKRDIAPRNSRAKRAFEVAMTPERVTRKKRANSTTTTKKRTRKTTKKATS